MSESSLTVVTEVAVAPVLSLACFAGEMLLALIVVGFFREGETLVNGSEFVV